MSVLNDKYDARPTLSALADIHFKMNGQFPHNRTFCDNVRNSYPDFNGFIQAIKDTDAGLKIRRGTTIEHDCMGNVFEIYYEVNGHQTLYCTIHIIRKPTIHSITVHPNECSI